MVTWWASSRQEPFWRTTCPHARWLSTAGAQRATLIDSMTIEPRKKHVPLYWLFNRILIVVYELFFIAQFAQEPFFFLSSLYWTVACLSILLKWSYKLLKWKFFLVNLPEMEVVSWYPSSDTHGSVENGMSPIVVSFLAIFQTYGPCQKETHLPTIIF